MGLAQRKTGPVLTLIEKHDFGEQPIFVVVDVESLTFGDETLNSFNSGHCGRVSHLPDPRLGRRVTTQRHITAAALPRRDSGTGGAAG